MHTELPEKSATGLVAPSSPPFSISSKAEHKQVQTAQTVSWLFCCLQKQPHKNSVLIKRGGHSRQPEPEPPIHRCSLISLKFLSTGKCGMLWPPSVQGPLSASLQGPSLLSAQVLHRDAWAASSSGSASGKQAL